MKILKILFFIAVLFCLYSCGGSHDSDEEHTTTTTNNLYTSEYIWQGYHCKINDTRNIAGILPYYTKDARYLFGRKGGFWIQKFTMDGDSIWSTVLKDGYSANFPILLSNGNIAISEQLKEGGGYCFPIIISGSSGNAKIINQSDISIVNINSYTNFFICNHDQFDSQLDNLQIDNDGNIIRRDKFDNIPEGNSYRASSDNYVRKEFTFWIDNKEYISVTNSSIRRANLDKNIWATSISLIPDVSKADISITIKNNVVIVKYNCSGEEMMRKFNYTTGKMINDVDNPEGDGKDMPNG